MKEIISSNDLNGDGRYYLRRFTNIDLNGKIMQNFEVTKNYIFTSYKSRTFKDKKDLEKNNLLKDYAALSTTTIKRYNKKTGKSSYVVLRNAGHSQNFDLVGSDTIYTNDKAYWYSEDNFVASPAFQILKFSSSINAKSSSNGYNVIYDSKKTNIKSDSYYFTTTDKNQNKGILVYEDLYNENYKNSVKTNIQVAVDEEKKLIAVHAYKIKKVYIFNMNLSKKNVNNAIYVVDLCQKSKSSYACVYGNGNQGLAFNDNRIYIANGGSDTDGKGNVLKNKIPTIIKINLKQDSQNKYIGNDIEEINFKVRTALENLCKNLLISTNNCNDDKLNICYNESDLAKEITIEVEGVSASKYGVYLGIVFKKTGGKRFNYIYRLNHTSKY